MRANDTEMTATVKLYIDNLPNWVHLLGFLLYVALIVLALTANAAVLFVFYRIREIRSVTNNLLCNMVGANMLLALQTPMEGVSILNDSWNLGNSGCKIHRLLLYTFYNVSVLSFTAISIERYYAICSPLRFNNLEKISSKLILALWIASTVLSSPQAFLSSSIATHGKMVCTEEQPGEEYLAVFLSYHVPNFLCLYLIPLGILTVTYLRVSKKLYYLVERYRQRSRFDICRAMKMRKNTIRMLSVVIVVFFVCLTPFKVVELLHVTPVLNLHDPHGILQVSVSLIAFSYAFLSPIVCSFMSRDFRKATKRAFSCSYSVLLKFCSRNLQKEGDLQKEQTFQTATHDLAADQEPSVNLYFKAAISQVLDAGKEGLHNHGFTLSFETLSLQNGAVTDKTEIPK